MEPWDMGATGPYPWHNLPLADPERVKAIEDLTALEQAEGYVWCDKWGDVHDDSLNPHGYSEDPETVAQSWCTEENHRALYCEIPNHTAPVPSGLTPGGSCREPEPVRSNPVPLTVRRHTPESRAIWRSNLRAALPVDLIDEDKDRITDALLASAIAMGDELRRKRIIDKLMTTANAMDYADREPIEMSGHLGGWADLLRDAAEEIRSILEL